jgi:four helix bundle protein
MGIEQRRTKRFRDLIAWQKAMATARDVYRITESFPRSEQFGLTAQMRRAAVSIPSNIAEGHGRLTDKGFKVFLAQARGSAYELETQLELAADLSYCPHEIADTVIAQCQEVSRILNGLLRTLRTNG